MKKWYGQIPQGWNVIPLKYISEIITGNTPPKSNDNYYADKGIPWYKPDNILEFDELTESKEYLTSEGASVARLIPANSVLMCCIGSIGKLAMNKEICVTNQQINSVVFNVRYCKPKYGFYALLSCKDESEKLSNKVVVSILNKSTQGNIEIPLPDLKLQKTITEYLDIKSEQINQVISKKLLLIDLLEKQRQSIITEAVTKGLNPNVKMKDSGVEWIGEVPEHWETKALKYCFKVGNGKEIDIELDKEDDTGINVYGSGGVFKKTDKVLFDGESVLFGRKGTIGKPLYVNDAFWTVDTMYYTKFYKDSNPKWFYYLLLVYPWDMIVTQTALPSIVGSDVANTVCAIPSFEEQVEIAEYLSLKDGKYFKVIASINNQIHKLKEYRQALIYEAVTGKIDVRNLELN